MQDSADGEEPILAGTAREEVRSVSFGTYDEWPSRWLGINYSQSDFIVTHRAPLALGDVRTHMELKW